MTDNGFISLLAFGAALLAGILTVVHVSAYQLNKRLQQRRHEALAPDVGAITDPELDFGSASFGDAQIQGRAVSVQVRQAETAR